MRYWLPLLLVLTACSPTVHVVEGPEKATFETVDVCTLLQDSDVERQRLAKTTPLGDRSCGFEFGEAEGKVSVEVTLTPESLEEAKQQFCAGHDGCRQRLALGHGLQHAAALVVRSKRARCLEEGWNRRTLERL